MCFRCVSREGMGVPREAPTLALPQHTGRREGDHAFNLQVLMVGPSQLQ